MTRTRRLPLKAACASVLVSCACMVFAGEGPPAASQDRRLDDPVRTFESFFEPNWPPFADSPYGNGHFGRWVTDQVGDPAYVYTMDQASDPRASRFVTGGTSCDHWHMLGNDRIVATAHNGGYVQLYDWTRGGKILNRWQPEAQNYAGGFKFVRTGGQTFNTLWTHRPNHAAQERIFGVGYFEKVTRTGDLVITERIEAPPGDDPVLLSTTLIENRGSTPRSLSVVEFWDVNLHQLTAAVILSEHQRGIFQQQRALLNRKFVMTARWNATQGVLSIDLKAADAEGIPAPSEPALVDYHPKTIFLAALDPLPASFGAYAVDQYLFFGKGGIDSPEPPGVIGAADGKLFERRSAYGGKGILTLRREVALAPGGSVRHRYLYGYADPEDVPRLAAAYRRPFARRRRASLQLAVADLPWLGRELSWHSYYLQGGLLYQDFYQTHFIDQGSAYGYLQGLTGAHRDFALFVLPMVYLRPEMAKEMLRFSMRSQHPETGALPYMHIGFGKISGALIHARSSDLDLFFLWALAEYLAATRDMAFLSESVPYYAPADARTDTVLAHARAAFDHLTDRVKLGPHGILHCGSGDWNDELIALSPQPARTGRHGESALNAGLATLALPAMAGAVESSDREFAAALRTFAASQTKALRQLWTGKWVARGYLGQGDAMLGKDRLFLDAQPFGVLGGVWTPAELTSLFREIRIRCVDPQPAGALSLDPPVSKPALDPGSDTNGGTWAAIDAWTAWAWSKHAPKDAWDFYLTTTLAAHAEAYPDIWYGVWSGPDAYNAHYHRRPGETFHLNFAAMTDFPVMNMNRHAGPLLAAIKLAGIEPRDGVIVINPRLPVDTFALRLPLIGVAYAPKRHRGYYVPVVDGTFRFAVRPPAGLSLQAARLTLNAQKAAHTVDPQGRIRFEAPGRVGKRITWQLE